LFYQNKIIIPVEFSRHFCQNFKLSKNDTPIYLKGNPQKDILTVNSKNPPLLTVVGAALAPQIILMETF